ncbi:Hypothetical protein R9X50_00033600 [Acrodontium crateriforme]|uniref:Serine-threonine/tyrosine-protein kinase catalytic domain-containing protein n=1 Tax=Acrodontium crateriforme TaxID=150365 RepID=A0AAQ3LYM4_9PEZI|nr:Hypothetical protein R9X50_00033600 [Acrodontium crateriforme]
MGTTPNKWSTVPEEPSYWQPPGVQRNVAYRLDALQEEADRYQHIGPHDNLVTFKEVTDEGFLLFEYCERGTLRDVIGGALACDDKTKFGSQITRCLIHLHNSNYIHCDLNVDNVFITAAMDAKVGDLHGQLYRSDGTIEMPTMSEENPKSRHPHAGEDEFSINTDVLTPGTLLYHKWHGTPPFPELNEYTQDEEIQTKYREGNCPVDSSQARGIDEVISKCWRSKYKDAKEVLNDMTDLFS